MNNEFQFYMEIVRKRGMNKKVKEYKICRTSEVEAEKKETANPRRRNGPKVRMDGGCYTNQKSTRNRRRGRNPSIPIPNVKISRTSEVEAKKKPGNPAVEMDRR